MTTRLKDNISSIGAIIDILSNDDSFEFIFDNNSDEQLSRQFFSKIKGTFELVGKMYISLDDTCTITGDINFPIEYKTSEDIMLSYSLMLRYISEYISRIPDGYNYVFLARLLEEPKKFESLFHLWGEAVFDQLDFIFNQSQYYFIRKLLIEINLRVSKTTEINSTLESIQEIKDEVSTKFESIEGKEKIISDLFESKVKETNEYIEEKEKHITTLREYLDGVVSGYNFAGLTGAYRDFYTSKNKERWASLVVLVVLAIASFLPMGIKVSSESSTKLTDINLMHYLGVSALTIILLYFFKVALQNYNSIKTELTQIKLRMNLCMFVDNYSDFSKSKDNREALDKFENIIFSNIQLNENNIPSTFDGLEQLASLIDSLTKRSK
ncbi:hypothetical protein [Providencia sp. JUb39]|uniref:hypothetical protein n=1 Tax=Providencia sp. JUb39 TaxID=2724165 RepID=UPI00164E6A1D|nr:hypothetical protein [Providencia sp. JUb39]MBC5790787.1 hypothetical protein [Providencia sp. JUb39]